MSYEIIYDKQFVRIPRKDKEDEFIPLIYAGSNNCYEYTGKGRERRERDWWCFSYLCPDNQLWGTEKQILKKIADWREKIIKQKEESDIHSEDVDNSFGYYASLAIGGSTRQTTYGNVKGIVVTGVRKSLTVEQLMEHDVCVTIGTSYYYEGTEDFKPFSTVIQSTNHLMDVLEKVNLYKSNGHAIEVSINASEWKMKQIRKTHFPKKKKQKERVMVDKYYTIVAENGSYFVRRLKYGYRYSHYPYHKFATEAAANRKAKVVGGSVELINEQTQILI